MVSNKKGGIALLIILLFGIFLISNFLIPQSWWWEIPRDSYDIVKIPLTEWVGERQGNTDSVIISAPGCSKPVLEGLLSPEQVTSSCGSTRATFTVPNYKLDDLLFAGIYFYAIPELDADIVMLIDNTCDYNTITCNGIVCDARVKYDCFNSQKRDSISLSKCGSYGDESQNCKTNSVLPVNNGIYNIDNFYYYDMQLTRFSGKEFNVEDAKILLAPNTQHTIDIWGRGSSTIDLQNVNLIFFIKKSEMDDTTNGNGDKGGGIDTTNGNGDKGGGIIDGLDIPRSPEDVSLTNIFWIFTGVFAIILISLFLRGKKR